MVAMLGIKMVAMLCYRCLEIRALCQHHQEASI